MYPPHFDKCDIARAIYDTTRDETLIAAMTIALYAKYEPRTDGRSTMGELADVFHIRSVMNERVSRLGLRDLDVMVRIFDRQIMTYRRSNDRNYSVRPWP